MGGLSPGLSEHNRPDSGTDIRPAARICVENIVTLGNIWEQ